MSQPNRESEIFEYAENYWDTHPAARASILVDSGYSLALALNFDMKFSQLNPWAQRAVTKTVTLMMEEVE